MAFGDTTDPARTRRIFAAAVEFVAAMRVPDDRSTRLADWQEQQTAALAALVAAVEQDVVRKEATDATDS